MTNKLDIFAKNIIMICPLIFILGPFLSNLSVFLISIFFIISVYLKKNFNILKKDFFIIFLIFNFYIIIRSIFSETPLFSLESSLFYFRFIIFSIAIGYYLDKFHELKKYFFYIALICLIFLFIDSTFQYYFKYNIFMIPMHPARVSSIFGEELIMGGYVLRLLPLILLCLYSLNFKTRFQNLYFFIILFISVCLILLSGERTAFFLLIIFLFFLFIYFNNKITNYIFAFIVIAFVLLSLLITGIFERMYLRTYDQIFDNSNVYIFSVQHHAHYLNATKIFLDNPLFGIGPKNFRKQCSDEKYRVVIKVNDTSHNGCQVHPHNIYLQLLAETGILGFMFLTSLFFFISYKICLELLRAFKNTELRKYPLYLSLVAIMLSIFPLSPSGNFFGSSFSFMFYLSLGFLFSNLYKLNLDEE